MAIEIERRFLVQDPRRALAPHTIIDQVDIRQGYFGRVNGLKLRVRIMFDAEGRSSAVLTRKSPRRGICREEYEQPTGVDAAEQALRTLPPSHIIRKRRYRVLNDDVVWSVDCFEGQNAGLVIAEIELAHPGQSYKLPAWAGPEITMDPRYGNSALARSPILRARAVTRDHIARTDRAGVCA
jgi:adenylate cyclase